MKRILIFMVFLIIPIFLYAQFGGSLKSYEIEELYGVEKVEYGTLAITKYGRMEEIEKILVPIKLDIGKYKVVVNKIDMNLYEIVGKDIYIKTRSCFETAFREEVILEITSSYGWSKGKIHF